MTLDDNGNAPKECLIDRRHEGNLREVRSLAVFLCD